MTYLHGGQPSSPVSNMLSSAYIDPWLRNLTQANWVKWRWSVPALVPMSRHPKIRKTINVGHSIGMWQNIDYTSWVFCQKLHTESCCLLRPDPSLKYFVNHSSTIMLKRVALWCDAGGSTWCSSWRSMFTVTSWVKICKQVVLTCRITRDIARLPIAIKILQCRSFVN